MTFSVSPLKTQQLLEDWSPVLEHASMPAITDRYKKTVVAQLMENTAKALESERATLLTEAPSAPTNNWANPGAVDTFDPILISMVRRALPNLMAFDTMGVQPMTGPTGMIFAMRSMYGKPGENKEAFYNEADTIFSGIKDNSTATTVNTTPQSPLGDFLKPSEAESLYSGIGMKTSVAETLGSDATVPFNEMSLTIEKVVAEAKTRALKAEYSIEMAQDLKAIHGMDAEAELANMLSAEILAEINRECVRTIYHVAKYGCEETTTTGIFDLNTDSAGRWSVERWKGLIYQIERECNAIAKSTRRGKGNVLIVSSDIASALAMSEKLDYAPKLRADMSVDDTGNTFAGVLNGNIKVYIDPYFTPGDAVQQLCCVGYKGSDAKDAGLFYCPYVPLQMVRAIDPNTFQPKLGFKTRYAMVANPFAEGKDKGNGALNAHKNVYYRIFGVNNIL